MSAKAKRCADSCEPLKWSLLCVLPPGSGIKMDFGMAIIKWWGRRFPSDLEFEIERALRPQNLGHAAYQWFYSLFRGLGNAAPDLVSFFAKKNVKDIDAIMAVLRTHPLHDSGLAELAKKYGNTKFKRDQPPSGEVLALWNAGALDIGCSGKTEIHPAVLAACDFKKRIESMIIAGQTQIYLPMSQAVYLWLKSRIEKRFGTQWADSLPDKPDSIGKLAWLLRNHFRHDTEREAEVAALWRDVRNHTAHGRFLPFNLALKSILEYDKLIGEEEMQT